MTRKRIGQSAIEYVCVAVVFCTVGVLAFLGTQRDMASSRRGTQANYQDKIVGRMLGNQTTTLAGTWGGPNATSAGDNPAWDTNTTIEIEENATGSILNETGYGDTDD